MVIYLAGKYRGDIDANIKAAREIAIELWEAGHTCISPHMNTQNFERDCNLPEREYIKRDLQIVARCDAVVMIPGWHDSEGAKDEWAYAFRNGIPIYQWPDYPEVE